MGMSMTEPRSRLLGRIAADAARRARLLLFAASMAPMAIWLLSAGRLARPLEAAAWALLCAVLAASAPGRVLKWAAIAQFLLLPLTLAWIGAVAVTGMGPSTASIGSATNGAYKEVLTAARVVMRNLPFQLVAVLSVVLSVAAVREVLRARSLGTTAWLSLVFLAALLPASATVLDAGGYAVFARLAGPEARMGVVWLSHLEMGKEGLRVVLNQSVLSAEAKPQFLRSTVGVPHEFDARPGVAVFIVGESLRADALLDPARGRWSAQLAARLERGLGVRLPDACAGGNGTFVSVPRLLTAVDVADTEGAAHQPTLLAIAKAAGARTAYINNHEIWVVPEEGHDFAQKISSMDVNTYDEVAIDAMADFLKRTDAASKAVLIHLYGQHFFYEQRYPAAMFPPEPAGLAGEALNELRYRRAAEYGASVLLRAAEVLDAQPEPAFLVFTSDHGENLLSDGSGRRMHAGPTSSLGDSVVPAIVLWNSAFQKSGRAKVLDVFRQASGLIAHRDVARAWLTMLGQPGGLVPTRNPQTWGALEPGAPVSALPCSALRP